MVNSRTLKKLSVRVRKRRIITWKGFCVVLQIIAGLVGILIISVFGYSIIQSIKIYKLFEFDVDENHRHRKCKKCGQIQESHTDLNSHSCWWEDMRKIPDENCKCHNYSEYKA